MKTHEPAPRRDGDGGLTAAEAARRLALDGPNALPTARGARWRAYAREVVGEPMFVLLIAASLLYAAIGDRAEAIFLAASVVLVIAVTLVQKVRSQRAVEALRDLAAPVARVIRDGTETRVRTVTLVRGDLAIVGEGDRIPADGEVVQGFLLIDEALLTGESVAVEHHAGGDRAVMAGTRVLSGTARIRVTATGPRSTMGRLAGDVESAPEIPSHLQLAARRVVRFFAIVALALAASLALATWAWRGASPVDAALVGIALAMATLPEEIPVVLVVFYALGARRIARRQVLTRQLTAVEQIGTISLLAVDKTGTLTRNVMEVAALVDADGHRLPLAGGTSASRARLVDAALSATAAESSDPSDAAIRAFAGGLDGNEPLGPTAKRLRDFPLAEGRPRVSCCWMRQGDDRWFMATKGAPEALLSLCATTPLDRARFAAAAQAMAAGGVRVLAVAVSAPQAGDVPDDPARVPHTMLGLIGLADPLRDDVPDAVETCRTAGIRVVMLTGDHAATATAIAAQAGIASTRTLTGAEIDALDDATLRRYIATVNVFARIRPAQKLRLVGLFRDAGYVVGMTGDGVNDAPALATADVGIAMGARGSDVARETADLVLLDDRFASLVDGIRAGRQVHENVRRAIRFIAAVHVPVICLAILPVLLGWPPVLLPVQIVLVELVIDPACSIVFESIPASADVMRRPPRATDDSPFSVRNLGRGLVHGAEAGGVLLLAYVVARYRAPSDELPLAVFLGLLTATLVLLLASAGFHRWRSTPWIPAIAVFTAGIAACVAGIPAVRGFLHVGAPGVATLLLVAGVAVFALAWIAVSDLVWRRIGRRRDASPGGAEENDMT